LLERFWRAAETLCPLKAPSIAWRMCLATAVVEVADNCIRHAYRDMPAGSMELRLRLYQDCVVARITDCGLALVSLPPPVELDLLAVEDLPEGGYGLGLARAAVDRLDYRRTPNGTNCWRLLKRLDTDGEPSNQSRSEA
jgi:serine/threonine-protein kinase RsbW